MRDLALGGYFFPGLLIVGLIALLATLLLQPLIFSARGPVAAVPAAVGLSLYRAFLPAPAGRSHAGVIRMTLYLTLLGRYAPDLGAVAAAALLAFIFWKQEAQTPWTRDGRMRADVGADRPNVSGPVASVAVKDNQWVNRGEVLYTIDPRWLKLAVSSAQAEVEARRRRWRCARMPPDVGRRSGRHLQRRSETDQQRGQRRGR